MQELQEINHRETIHPKKTFNTYDLDLGFEFDSLPVQRWATITSSNYINRLFDSSKEKGLIASLIGRKHEDQSDYNKKFDKQIDGQILRFAEGIDPKNRNVFIRWVNCLFARDFIVLNNSPFYREYRQELILAARRRIMRAINEAGTDFDGKWINSHIAMPDKLTPFKQYETDLQRFILNQKPE